MKTRGDALNVRNSRHILKGHRVVTRLAIVEGDGVMEGGQLAYERCAAMEKKVYAVVQIVNLVLLQLGRMD